MSKMINDYLRMQLENNDNPIEYAQKVHFSLESKRLKVEKLQKEIKEERQKAREILGLEGNTTLDDYLKDNVIERIDKLRQGAIDYIIKRISAPDKKLEDGSFQRNEKKKWKPGQWYDAYGHIFNGDYGIKKADMPNLLEEALAKWQDNGGKL